MTTGEKICSNHLYKVGFSSYEESYYVELYHEKKFSEKDFTKMIAEAIISIIKNKKEHDYFHGLHDFFSQEPGIEQFLIEKKGFKPVIYECFWSAFGWPSVFDKKDWGSDRDKNLDNLTKILNKVGYNKKDDDFLKK